MLVWKIIDVINWFSSKIARIRDIFLHRVKYTIGGGMGIPQKNRGVEWVYSIMYRYLKKIFKYNKNHTLEIDEIDACSSNVQWSGTLIQHFSLHVHVHVHMYLYMCKFLHFFFYNAHMRTAYIIYAL